MRPCLECGHSIETHDAVNMECIAIEADGGQCPCDAFYEEPKGAGGEPDYGPDEPTIEQRAEWLRLK